MTTPGKVQIYERTIEVTRVLMHNPQSRYAIVKAVNPDKPPEQREEKVFKGTLDYPKEGGRFKVKFVQEYDATRKEHYFKIRHSELDFKQQSESGLVEYLTREGPNLGDKRARELVQAFGSETIDTLAFHKEKVLEKRKEGHFDGLTEARLEELSEWAQAEKNVEKMKQTFYSLGLTPSLVSRLIGHFGHQSPAILKNDPFRFNEVDGVGFATAWKIAKAAGCPVEDPNRIRHGILYVLSEYESEGHCCMEQKDLVYKAQQLLEVSQSLVEQHLKSLLDDLKLCSSETNLQSLSQVPELFDIVE